MRRRAALKAACRMNADSARCDARAAASSNSRSGGDKYTADM
jgi:hypothetical protein